MGGRRRSGRGPSLPRRSGPPCDPEAALVGEILHGARFLGDVGAHHIVFVRPAGGGKVGEDFGAFGQVHERAAADIVLKVTVAEFEEAGILRPGGPAHGFKPPHDALGVGMVAVVRGEQKRRAGTAHGGECAESLTTVATSGNLHEAVEHEERAVKGGAAYRGTFFQLRGVGVMDGDGRAAFIKEGAGLIDEFLGEIKRGEAVVAELPEAERDATGPAAGFEEVGGLVGEEALDEQAFGFP